MGISIWQLLIILAIVVVLFGTKRLRNVGSDLGGAIRSFRQALKDGEESAEHPDEKDRGRIIDAEVTHKDKDKV